MPRRSQRGNTEDLRNKLVKLLQEFETKLADENLREQVKGLIPANHILRDLGSSLITEAAAGSASDRIIAYLRKYTATLVHGDELMVVAGISEYGRRIRELRVQRGWPILSGKALIQILEAGEKLDGVGNNDEIKPDTYILLENAQDRDSAHRWNIANEIRKSSVSVKDKILSYLRKNVGKKVTGEELKYLAKDKSEWPRRVRELRTEDGWPVVTKVSGSPDLPVGVYVLEEDRQAEVHDRKIPDPVRVEVLERDGYSCKKCTWSHKNRKEGDKLRSLLELHHIKHHAHGGENTPENLITLCNICHDDVHRGNVEETELFKLIN